MSHECDEAYILGLDFVSDRMSNLECGTVSLSIICLFVFNPSATYACRWLCSEWLIIFINNFKKRKNSLILSHHFCDWIRQKFLFWIIGVEMFVFWWLFYVLLYLREEYRPKEEMPSMGVFLSEINTYLCKLNTKLKFEEYRC